MSSEAGVDPGRRAWLLVRAVNDGLVATEFERRLSALGREAQLATGGSCRWLCRVRSRWPDRDRLAGAEVQRPDA